MMGLGNWRLVEVGSKTAKDGFKNEYDVINKFNNWKIDSDAQCWLIIMGYKLNEIERVVAVKIKDHYKTDVQAQVTIYFRNAIDAQNLSVKLISDELGYNQIDKRWVDTYKDLWNMPGNIVTILKKYTGEIYPNNGWGRDSRRMFFDEMGDGEQETIVKFFRVNKLMIITDILKGRGQFAAEWMLVICKPNIDTYKWVLQPMNVAMNFFGDGDICISERGSLHIGKITMQRKGGDNGRPTANMLQFKMSPGKLFESIK